MVWRFGESIRSRGHSECGELERDEACQEMLVTRGELAISTLPAPSLQSNADVVTIYANEISRCA